MIFLVPRKKYRGIQEIFFYHCVKSQHGPVYRTLGRFDFVYEYVYSSSSPHTSHTVYIQETLLDCWINRLYFCKSVKTKAISCWLKGGIWYCFIFKVFLNKSQSRIVDNLDPGNLDGLQAVQTYDPNSYYYFSFFSSVLIASVSASL